MIFTYFQLYFFVIPFTFTLSSVCFYRYNRQVQLNSSIFKYRFNPCFRIYTVYIIYIYSLFFILFWSFIMTASYKFSWIISPFGSILIIFSIVLYIKSHRLKIEDFKLIEINEVINQINQEKPKSFQKLEEQQTMLDTIRS